jgi:hypothetical protein
MQKLLMKDEKLVQITYTRDSRQFLLSESRDTKYIANLVSSPYFYYYYSTHAQLAEFEKEIQWMIDVKIRWNSLHFKLERFDKVKNCILKSLIDLDLSISFDEEVLNMIHNLMITLESVKLAMETLFRRDVTLLSADTMIFLCDQQYEHQQLSRSSFLKKFRCISFQKSSKLMKKGNVLYIFLINVVT